jgi:hypothetical protein
VEGEADRYLTARPGDSLMCPFECDSCLFWKLKKRSPAPSATDERLLSLIRRANLDAFWALEPRTVAGNLSETYNYGVDVGRELGLAMFDAVGPWDPEYDHGTRAALAVLLKSLRPGRHEPTMKFSAVRKARTVFSNVWRASSEGTAKSLFWRIDGKKRGVSSKAPTESEWFTRFMKGVGNRMGQRTRQDAAISIDVMTELMARFDSDFVAAEDDPIEQRGVAEAACFCVLAFCGSFRGFEVPKVVLTYLRDFRERSTIGDVLPHVGIPLAGRFKLRGNMDQNLLVYVAAETASGLKPLLWVDRLINLLEGTGIVSGWLFQGPDGEQLKMRHFEERVFEKLLDIQSDCPHLIPGELDVYEAFGLARSFRRGATTRAQNCGVSQPDIDWINRWRSSEGADDAYFSGDMRVHYSDTRQMTQTFLRFSLAL